MTLSPTYALAALALALLAAAGCNTRTMANEKHCRALSADECRADSTCVAVGGKGLEPLPAAVAQGKRCEPGCAKGWMPDECVWTPPAPGSPPDRTAADGRVCTGPPRCQLNRTNSGDHCFDPDPPCAGCRQVFDHCQSANLCSGVICP